MKKRRFSAALTAVLAAALSFTGMASETKIESSGGTASHDVSAVYTPVKEAEVVYSVDIKWGSMEFTYTAPDEVKTWNPESHTYSETLAGEGKWTNEEKANEIVLTNRSNKALTAAITVEMLNAYSGITPALTVNTLSLEDASIGATTSTPGTASEASTAITLKGALTDKTASKTTVGNVTVTIKDAEEVQP